MNKKQNIDQERVKRAKNALELWKIAHFSGYTMVSFSQLSMFLQCPYKWKLNYIDRVKRFKPNIYLLFGSAMHTVVEKFIETFYSSTITAANDLDLNTLLFEEMRKEFKKILLENKAIDSSFTNKDQMSEFYNDGINAIDDFKKKRGKYISKKNHELVGTEIPILYIYNEEKKIAFAAFMDFGIKDAREEIPTYDLFDIKTSTRGWRDFEKKNFNKIQQLLLSKYFFSKTHDIPLNDINVKYLIFKRKIQEDSPYPISRIQEFSPSNGKVNVGKAIKNLDFFIDFCFDDKGKKRTDIEYPKKESKLCDWCEYQDICERK